jgi:hypothetical protein
MILSDIQGAVRTFQSTSHSAADDSNRFTSRIHNALHRGQTPSGAIQAIATAPSFCRLLGNHVVVDEVDNVGARMTVDGERTGLIYDTECNIPDKESSKYSRCKILICTNYDRYNIFVKSNRKSYWELCWSDTAAGLEDALEYHNGLLRLARVADWAIVSRSFAIDLPTDNALTKERFERQPTEERALTRIGTFVHEGSDLKSILRVHGELFSQSEVQTSTLAHAGPSSRMHVLYPALSEMLNYTSTVTQPNRGDYISTYISSDGREWCREFMLDWQHDGEYSDELRLLEYNIMYLLAIRRTKLFRSKYSSRLYSLMLPPAILSEYETPVLAIIPLVSLSRLPNTSRFRRTISLTIIAIPIRAEEGGALVARRPDVNEIDNIAQEIAMAGTVKTAKHQYDISGPLVNYVSIDNAKLRLPYLVSSLALSLARRTCGQKKSSLQASDASALKGLKESSIGSICYLLDWPGGRDAPWAKWCAGGEDRTFERVLHRAIFLTDYTNPAEAFSTNETVDFRSLSVGSAHGADMSGLTFYNPQDDFKYVLYPRGSERYPNHSMLRWFAWQVYLDVAFSSVRALLGRFHDNIDTTTDLRRAVKAVQDLSTELSEVYDLDLADFFYRREHEKLRSIMHMDNDYEYMRDRLASAQGESSLREQILMNNLVLALTLASVFATLIVAIGQVNKWSAEEYLYGAASTIIGSLLVSFGLMEYLRNLTARLKSFTAGRRR